MPKADQGPELGLGVLFGQSLAGLGAARGASVKAEGAQLAAAAAAAALDQRLSAARAWIELSAAEASLAGARREEELAVQLAALASRSRALAASTAADDAAAQAFLAEVRVAALDAEGEVFDRAAALAAELGEPLAVFSCAGPLPAPAVPEVELARAAASLPPVQVEVLRARAERARAVEERAQRGLHLGYGLSGLRDGTGAVIATATLQLTLPAFDRGDREAGAREAEALRADASAARARVQATGQLRRALHEVEHSAELLGLLSTALAPAASEAARLTERLHAQAEIPLTDVLQARRLALSAGLRVTRARAAHAWARVRAFLLASAVLPEESR